MRTVTRLFLDERGAKKVYRLGTETENLRAAERWQPIQSVNGPDQWLAAKRLSAPQGFIASPLHRVVLRRQAWTRTYVGAHVVYDTFSFASK